MNDAFSQQQSVQLRHWNSKLWRTYAEAGHIFIHLAPKSLAHFEIHSPIHPPIHTHAHAHTSANEATANPPRPRSISCLWVGLGFRRFRRSQLGVCQVLLKLCHLLLPCPKLLVAKHLQNGLDVGMRDGGAGMIMHSSHPTLIGRGIIFEHRFWIIFEHRCPGSFSNTEWVIFDHMGGYPAAGGAVTFASYCVTVPLRPGGGAGGGVGRFRSPLTA